MAFSLHGQRDKRIEQVSAKYFYSLTLSAFSVVIAVMLLFPHNATFRHYPLDLVLCIAWFVAFTFLLIEFTGQHQCDQNFANNLPTIALGGDCNTRRAAFSFAFLAGCFWLGTTVISCWIVSRGKKMKRRTVDTIPTPA